MINACSAVLSLLVKRQLHGRPVSAPQFQLVVCLCTQTALRSLNLLASLGAVLADLQHHFPSFRELACWCTYTPAERIHIIHLQAWDRAL